MRCLADVVLLRLLPELKILGIYTCRENAVDNHGIDAQPIQAKIHKRALRLFDNNFLWIRHQPHRRNFRIGEHAIDAFQFIKKVLDILEVGIARQRHVANALNHGPRNSRQIPLKFKNTVHIPLQRRRNAHEPERFACRRAIEDDDIVSLLAHVLVNIEERADFFHPRKDSNLLSDKRF